MDLIYLIKGDISLLIVSHKMSAIEKCDKIINLNDYQNLKIIKNKYKKE